MFGGSKDNAIPREACATVAVRDVDSFKTLADKYACVVSGELSDEDAGFFCRVESVADVTEAMICCCRQQKMSGKG